MKKKHVSAAQYRNLKNYLGRTLESWGHLNIRNIGYAEIEDSLENLEVSSETRRNYRSGLHTFFKWVSKRYRIPMPDFPESRFEMGYRTITDKKTQLKALDDIREHCQHEPRKWIAIRWLCLYPALRPDDIRRIREKDIDRRTGRVRIERPTKNKKTRTIWLLPEDLEMISALPRGFDHMPVFRLDLDRAPVVKAGDVFGKDLLYQAWRKAGERLGIEGLSLYAGTRHTTATDLQEFMTPDEIKEFATQHDTNQAFSRYFAPSAEKMIKAVQIAARKKTGKVVELKPGGHHVTTIDDN